MELLKEWKSKLDFRRTQKECAEDEMVCGVLRDDGTPVYFIMPKASTDAEVRAMAFLEREGRPMSRLELMFLNHAESRRA